MKRAQGGAGGSRSATATNRFERLTDGLLEPSRGNTNTSDFRAAIEQTVQAAYDDARFTAEPTAGLPDAGHRPTHSHRDTHCSTLECGQRRPRAWRLRCEAAALAVNKRITNNEARAFRPTKATFHAHARLSQWLRQLALASRGADCLTARAPRRNAARCLVQLAAQCAGAGQP